MDNPILTQVLQLLRDAGFSAQHAFPGQKFSGLENCVAAAHILHAEPGKQTVTVEVLVVCPAAMGGTACETEALKATRALCAAGGECVQSGCSYDSLARVYTVPVKAVFPWALAVGEPAPEFTVWISGRQIPNAIRIAVEETAESKAHYTMGSGAPAGIGTGPVAWKLTLEERIDGETAQRQPDPAEFSLKISRNGYWELYGTCRWISRQREWTRDGFRQISKAIALTHQEGQDG